MRAIRVLWAARVAVTGIVIAAAAPAYGQTSSAPAAGGITIEISGGAGETIMDKEKWSGQTSLNDWSGSNYRYGARALYSLGRAEVGAEVQYLYAYWYKLGSTYSYEERTVDPTVFGAVVRLPVQGALRLDLGAAAYQFASGTDLGANLALGYFIPLGAKLTLPIQARVDYIADSSTPVIPFSVTAGLSWRVR